ncbi:MAG TPA: response regulator, partial [bacterium]
VLDMIMPKMDGKETLRNIRKINPDAKAVLTSGRLDSDYSSRCVREGFSGFIPKPFMTSHFLKVVRQTLDK